MQEQFKLFQKIEITESTKQTKPGSIGYIISMSETGPYNILKINAIFTRFGKGGKNRFSVSMTTTPLMDIDFLATSKGSRKDIEMLVNQHLMPRNINGRNRALSSKIKIIHEESKNLIDLNTWDFMAYISAISLFIYSYGIHNEIGNNDNIDGITVNNIGRFICQMFDTKNLHDRLREYIEYFDDNHNREEWLDRSRKEISMCKQIVIKHLKAISNRYKSNYRFLRDIAMDNGLKIKKLDISDNLWL